MILLLLSLIGFSYADQFAPCFYQNPTPAELEMFERLNEKLYWHGANALQIDRAPCKNRFPPAAQRISEVLHRNDSPAIESQIHGVDLKDSPHLVEAFKKLTTALDMWGTRLRPENQKNLQAEFGINPECSKVECAVSKIWGPDMGPKMLYMLLRHGYNTSEYAFVDSDRFTKEELDDVIMGADDLPPHMMPIGLRSNQRLTHYSRGVLLNGYTKSVAANAIVMMFDAWSGESRKDRQFSVFHELSHNISDVMGDMDASPEWIALSGWTQQGEHWKYAKGSCFPSGYALTAPYEDYAESLSTYRYNGAEFKAMCPEKYAFIKDKVFKGIEYTSPDLCK